MNGTNEGVLPAITGDVIMDKKYYIDNFFDDTWKKLNNPKKLTLHQ